VLLSKRRNFIRSCKRPVQKDKPVKKQGGNVFVSMLLFVATLGITINMTLDFYRLNQNIQAVSMQHQGRSFLKADLEKQAKLVSTIRRSLLEPRNTAFRGCFDGTVACSTTPQGFFLSSPMVGDPPIAGTAREPTRYSNLGERCNIPGPGCENKALAFFVADSTQVKVWVEIQPHDAPYLPTLDPTKPNAIVLNADVKKPTTY
jgi:hypothetical protein